MKKVTVHPVVRDAVLKALGHALTHLSTAHPPEDEGIHAVRLALKAARAWLRLFRRPDGAHLQALRKEIAAVTRELGAVRNRAVIAVKTAKLARRHPEAVPLLVRLKAGDGKVRPPTGCAVALRTLRRRLRTCAWPALDQAALAAGLRHAYVRARRARSRVVERPTPKRVHAWRKALIVLRDQLGLFEDRLPRRLSPRSDGLRKTTALLGRACDRHLVEQALKVCARRGGRSADRLLHVLREERQALTTRALKRTEKAFAPRPREWAKRLG